MTAKQPNASASPSLGGSPGASGSHGLVRPPDVLGDFELRREIGRGGMGTVYEAWQQSLQRVVALKVLGTHVSSSPSAVLRFQREAQAAAKLHHTHIVPIYAQGEQDGIYFYAMELIEGHGLNAIIAEARRKTGTIVSAGDPEETIALPRAAGRVTGEDKTASLSKDGVTPPSADDSAVALDLPWDTSSVDERFSTVARHIATVADALDCAHNQGVIHRDIKPHNLMMGKDQRLRVADFGLARVAEQPGVTITGEFMGSPLYMSREQITRGSSKVDGRTDIYSLGATMYEWLTLHPPFPGETREAVISKILSTEAIAPRQHNPAIPVDLETICLKALERDLSRRYQTAGEMRDDLERFVARHPIKARRDGIFRRTRRLVDKHPVATVAVIMLVISGVLLKALVSSNKEVRSQTEAVRVAEATTEHIFDLLRSVSPEMELAARTAEGLAPMLGQVVETGQQVASMVEQSAGPNPAAVATAKGIAERIARDLYRAGAEVASGAPSRVGADDGPLGPEAIRSTAEADLLRQAEEMTDPAAKLDLVSVLLAVNPRNNRARQFLLTLMCQERRYDEMLPVADRLVLGGGDGVEPHVWRGLAHLLSGACDGAMEDCAHALKRDSLSPWARTIRGLALLETNRADEAVVDLTTALGASPDLVVAHLGRAAAHVAVGQYARAIEDLSRVIELEPENADAFAVRGEYYSSLGRNAEAAADYDQAIKLGGANREITLRYLFSVARMKGGPPTEGTATERPDEGTSPGEAAKEGADSSSVGFRGFLDHLLGRPVREAKGHRAGQASYPSALSRLSIGVILPSCS